MNLIGSEDDSSGIRRRLIGVLYSDELDGDANDGIGDSV